MDELLRRGSLVVTTLVGGLLTGYMMAVAYQKKKEKAVGGKLMRVNYRFTKDFDE